MVPASPDHLRAMTATGTPALSVVDVSVGGLLVQAAEPFPIGAVVHLQLSVPGNPLGTFALRCLHAHRTVAPDRTTAHISALVFEHRPDERTRETLAGLGAPERAAPPSGSRRILRFAVWPAD